MKRRSITLGGSVTILSGVLVLLGLYLTSLYSYLLFHSLAEVFSIVVACAVFMLAWNTRRFLDNNYLLFIGIAYLFVAGLDLLHTLAYKGMGVFEGQDANLPTQLWIAARYLQSISLLIAPLFLGRKLKPHFTFISYGVVTVLLLGSIFYWGVFPDCYVEGVGLTPFKKISEYLISLILLASIALLFQNRREFDRDVWRLLVWAILFTIGSELAFTFYVSVYGLSNLVGHFLKIISFYLTYKAIVVTGLVKPHNILFRNLKQSEGALRDALAASQQRQEELDAFAHTVAHDLKSPLAIIVSSASVLSEYYTTLSDDKRRGRLQAILQTAFRMTNIIDELLLLAEVRQAEVRVKPLNIAPIVARAQRRLDYMIEECGGEIISPKAWPPALGYAPWVEEVWVNYLSNAIQYGGQPPRVELGATAQPDGGMVRFWVSDNGSGLTPEDQARLFTPFTRLDQVQTKGHGLGLSIVQRIVEKLGGQVGVESEVGRGSMFFFTLPGVPG